MVLYENNFTYLTDLDPILTEIFYQHYNQHPQMRQQVFGMRRSTKAKETEQRIGSFGDPTEFNGAVEYETPTSGAEIEFRHTHFTKGFQITQVMLEDNQYDGIFQNASEMGRSFARKQEKDAWSVFNNCASSSFLGYDGKALCADDHPRSVVDTTSVDNKLALALSSANLETAILAMQAFGDDKGEEISLMPDLLIVPRALRKTALEIAGSELNPETANNATNVHSGIRVMVVPWLTDTNRWFVVDSSLARIHLKWWDRIDPSFAAENTFDTLLRKFRGRMRYAYGWSDFRWIVMSEPS
jgi:phage major head subunit gpT-like protein